VVKKIVREHTLHWQGHARDVRVADGPPYQGVRSVICGVKGELTMLLTNLERAPRDVFDFYNQRQTIEAFFKASKHVFGWPTSAAAASWLSQPFSTLFCSLTTSWTGPRQRSSRAPG